jgi:hypothetical protein
VRPPLNADLSEALSRSPEMRLQPLALGWSNGDARRPMKTTAAWQSRGTRNARYNAARYSGKKPRTFAITVSWIGASMMYAIRV